MHSHSILHRRATSCFELSFTQALHFIGQALDVVRQRSEGSRSGNMNWSKGNCIGEGSYASVYLGLNQDHGQVSRPSSTTAQYCSATRMCCTATCLHCCVGVSLTSFSCVAWAVSGGEGAEAAQRDARQGGQAHTQRAAHLQGRAWRVECDVRFGPPKYRALPWLRWS